MTTLHSTLLIDPDPKKSSSGETQESIYPDHYEMNITDGGEFLDDAIRTKEQPFDETSVNENE